MHGEVAHPEQAVVTKDDYESYESRRHLFSTALQGDLVSKTFLFLGFSFNDPNINYILSRIRVLLGENRREHYCLLRRVQRGDCKKNSEYQYARAKQDLQVKDLKRYGIMGLLVDDYRHYTDVLRRIFYRYKLARVFISGSAAEYTPWPEQKAQQLLQAISSALIHEGFGIVSGFGLGIGPYVLNGILNELDDEGTRLLDDRVVLRPFPIAISDPAERKRRWTAYREDMLTQAGIALFVFGNKKTRRRHLPRGWHGRRISFGAWETTLCRPCGMHRKHGGYRPQESTRPFRRLLSDGRLSAHVRGITTSGNSNPGGVANTEDRQQIMG